MKKIPLSLALLLCITFFSCEKSALKDDFTKEISTEKAQIHVSESNFTIIEEESLNNSSQDYYTSGILKYVKNNTEIAKVNFGDGSNDSYATCYQNGQQHQIQLRQENCQFNGKKSQYKKVIVSPIVKSDDCDFIVSGIIKYYDLKTGNWTATVDFGDGTCDDIAVKTTSEGNYTFTISDYYN